MDYLYPDKYPIDYAEKLQYIRKEIENRLIGYTNLLKFDFCDVSAGGIQIRGFHKEVPNYSYIDVTLKYDFSNMFDCINDFVQMWIECDNERSISRFRDFIEDGLRYGWD